MMFYTNYKRVATGNPNVEECTFGRDLLNENSVAFAFLLRVCGLRSVVWVALTVARRKLYLYFIISFLKR